MSRYGEDAEWTEACNDGVHVVEQYNDHVCVMCGQQFCPDCGRDLDSFACKIRHIHVDTTWARKDH